SSRAPGPPFLSTLSLHDALPILPERRTMGSRRRVVLLFSGLMLVSGSAYAQATLAGVARDTSGSIVPGVTVEASSPALPEKVRRSEEHRSELQSREKLVCRLLLE